MELISRKKHAQDGRDEGRGFCAPRETVVEPNSCKIALTDGLLIARNIHSDLLLAFYAPTVKLGMMLRLGNNPDRITFAMSALSMVLAEISALGVRRQDLLVYEIGGVAPGTKCLRCLRQLLASKNIAIRASDVGNNQVRSAWLSVDSGRFIVRSQAK